MSYVIAGVIVHCIVSNCCSVDSAAIEHLGSICKQHGTELRIRLFQKVQLCAKVHKTSFLDLNGNFLEDRNEGGRAATPTSFSIFYSYDTKSLRFEFGHDIFAGFKMASL